MKARAIEGSIMAEGKFRRDDAEPIGNDSSQSSPRADTNAVCNDAFLHTSPCIDAYSSADDASSDIRFDDLGALPHHRLIDVSPNQACHRAVVRIG